MKIYVAVILFLVVVAAAVLALYLKYPTTSPLNSAAYLISSLANPHEKLKKDTIGFLAYWRMDDEDIESIRFDLLSEVIYFSLSVGKDGHIIKVVKNETDPGWLRWRGPRVGKLIARTKIMGGKVSLAVAMHKNELLEAFLDSKSAQQNLISDLKEEVKRASLDGLNLDFEYDGELEDPQYREKFTQFTEFFTSALKKEFPNLKISIDVFPLAVRKQRLVDVPKVAPNVDKVVIMAYDFYAAYSDTTGPIAPISGYSQGKFLFDINTAYQDFTLYVPQEKLILGVPYYGYDWPVESAQGYMSRTLEQNDENGYVEVLSYSRMRKDPRFNSKQCTWDELAQAPWCWYEDEETDTPRQAWFENNRSIESKFNFVNEKNLSGFAIWLLGYDRGYQDLWQMIQSKFGI